MMSINTRLPESCFIRFNEGVDSSSLPTRFTNPFNYDPHPLCCLAAQELQQYLLSQTEWEYDFEGADQTNGGSGGKMFGVLLVRNQEGEIGYLAAFSGNLDGKNNLAMFVPPVVDLLSEEGFYRKGENEISLINQRIKELEHATGFLQCQALCEAEKHQAFCEIEQVKVDMKAAKQDRDLRRQKAKGELAPFDLEMLNDLLKNESQKRQYDYKQVVKHWNQRIQQSQCMLDGYVSEIAALKKERKMKSADLQQRMFDQYQFLNFRGEVKGVCEIFQLTDHKMPPAAAGECAAPKLLQYAYQNQMTPLAMAEFWWGQSPLSVIRKQGHFYPACRSKCEPILGHMLQGLAVETVIDLQSVASVGTPEVIYDDPEVLVVNKPSGLLSVPGKGDADSVYRYIKQQFPNAEGPLIVHRLDMSTSGLMVIAKTMAAYHHLQNQFLNKTVKKRYVALLEGLVAVDQGVIELPLRVDLDNRPRQLVCYAYGKPAVTHWRVIERINQRTRIHFFPITGRTHQLRMHAAHPSGLNCPIVGDELYGQKANRLHLHAEWLSFIHPQSNEMMQFQVDAAF